MCTVVCKGKFLVGGNIVVFSLIILVFKYLLMYNGMVEYRLISLMSLMFYSWIKFIYNKCM